MTSKKEGKGEVMEEEEDPKDVKSEEQGGAEEEDEEEEAPKLTFTYEEADAKHAEAKVLLNATDAASLSQACEILDRVLALKYGIRLVRVSAMFRW